MPRKVSPPTQPSLTAVPAKSTRGHAGTSQTPPAVQPLRWGHWPSAETPITIEGQRGKWAFVQPFACGNWEAVLLIPWNARMESNPPRHVVPLADVRVPVPAAPPARKRA